ncbi:hypothetical protein SPHV1_410008 [Novosphingobium sp. KN65.2]|nr:hypothetical protein SPHV1_410008 [Novosphingobium sp. KN65.2]
MIDLPADGPLIDASVRSGAIVQRGTTTCRRLTCLARGQQCWERKKQYGFGHYPLLFAVLPIAPTPPFAPARSYAPKSVVLWPIRLGGEDSAFPTLAFHVRIRAKNGRSIWSKNSSLWFAASKSVPPLGYV